jgi:hypothetical protein
MSDQLHAPATLPAGKERQVPIGQEAEWDPDAIWTWWRVEKIPASAGNRTPVVDTLA